MLGLKAWLPCLAPFSFLLHSGYKVSFVTCSLQDLLPHHSPQSDEFNWPRAETSKPASQNNPFHFVSYLSWVFVIVAASAGRTWQAGRFTSAGPLSRAGGSLFQLGLLIPGAGGSLFQLHLLTGARGGCEDPLGRNDETQGSTDNCAAPALKIRMPSPFPTPKQLSETPKICSGRQGSL